MRVLSILFVVLMGLSHVQAVPDPTALSFVPKDTVLKEPQSLKASLFRGKTEAQGNLSVDESAFEHLIVYGDLSLKDSEIFGQSHIKGNLLSVNSHFRDRVYLVGNRADFKESVVSKITCEQAAKITLEDSTFVGGNIEFTKDAGEVVIVGDSQVLGKIINAKVIHKN